MPTKTKIWTPQDVKMLRSMCAQRATTAQICKRLRRSVAAVRNKTHALGIVRRRPAAKTTARRRAAA